MMFAVALASPRHRRGARPPMRFCVDNAAMIAGLGWHYLKAGRVADLHLDARATVRR